MAWLTNWNRRKSKVINGTTAGAQTNYQMKLTVHKGTGTDTDTDVYLGTNVRDDFGDVRFTNSTGSTLLPYWIESYTLGVSATIWVNIDSIPASPNTTTIYIYYDNPTAISESNIYNTLKFAEEWDIIDPTKWEDLECGNVNNPMVNIVNGKLRIQFSAATLHPDVGDKSKKLISLTSVIPSVMTFTLEVDSTSSGSSEEHSAITVISDEIHSDIKNDAAGICTDKFTNSLHFMYDIEQNSSSRYTAMIIRDGVQEILFSTPGDPTYGTISTWRVELLSKDKIRIYVNGNLEYSSDTLNFKNITDAYLYQGMYSSTGALRYVEFDYVRLFNISDPEPTWGASGAEETTYSLITAIDITVTPRATPCAEPCTIDVSVTWENQGNADGIFIPSLTVDNVPIPAQYSSEILAAGATVTHTFTLSDLTKGTHVICPDPN